MNEDNKNDPPEVILAAIEWTKQVTILATGTLVLSATFISDVLKGEVLHKCVLVWAWVFLAISAITGVLFMGSICSLFSSRNKDGNRTIYGLVPRAAAFIHFITFVIGLILFVYFASANFI